MAEKFLSLILYPALADGLQPGERDSLKTAIQGIEGIVSSQVIDSITQRLTLEEMKSLSAQVPDAEKQSCFFLARQIASAGGLTRLEQEALQELQAALNLGVEVVDFEIPEPEMRHEEGRETFENIARKFSMIAGAVGFLPTPFISDFTILAPLQVYMVNRIARFYDYPTDSKELVKMVIGTVGLGYACAVAARGLLAFVPIGGWVMAGGIAFAATYGIAIVAQKYIEQKGVLTEESIKVIYRDAYEEGKKQFKMLKADIWDKKDELLDELKKFTS